MMGEITKRMNYIGKVRHLTRDSAGRDALYDELQTAKSTFESNRDTFSLEESAFKCCAYLIVAPNVNIKQC